MFTVILCSGTQTVIKKIDINTVITLESLFPSYIRIIFRDFTRPICNSITGNTEQIAPSIGSFTTGINTVNYFIQIYTIRICQIHKTSSIPVRFIIAYKSKTSTQLTDFKGWKNFSSLISHPTDPAGKAEKRLSGAKFSEPL